MNKYSDNDLYRNLIKEIELSFKESFGLPAFTDYDTNETFTYGQAAQEIARLHALFRQADIKAGDKVALMGADCARWCIVFIATITYGAVIVPILQDFNPQDAERIIDHGDARILFLDKKLQEKISMDNCPQVEILMEIESLDIVSVASIRVAEEVALRNSIANRNAWKLASEGGNFSPDNICFAQRENSEIMYINYTSGTTGVSKGVLLTGQNIAGNALYAHKLDLMYRGHRELCFLPLAHAYSCAFNLITPVTLGAHVTILGKVPSPRVIMAAFNKVRPQLIITVPLILEKIYKQAIAPKLEEPLIKVLTHLPLLRRIVYRSIRKKLVTALGGEFCEVIVGGAALSDKVGKFLKKIDFPITVGYGMTECGPLISYENHKKWVAGSCGKPLSVMQVRIAHADGADPHQPGEIQVRGMNVCQGYYKNPEANAQLFTEDGWMHTGDLGTMDRHNNLFIRGRSKTMILSSNGQNIYPEEIETKINNFSLIAESLVVRRAERLVALIVPDQEAAQRDGLSEEEMWQRIEGFRSHLNDQVASYEKITRFIHQEEPFVKTPKRSIKRFLYES